MTIPFHDADERRELEELEQLARFLAERATVGKRVGREPNAKRADDDRLGGNSADGDNGTKSFGRFGFS